MKNCRYEMIIWWSDEDNAFVVDVPELPGCMAHGASRAEAIANGEEAIAFLVEDRESRWPACPATQGAPRPRIKSASSRERCLVLRIFRPPRDVSEAFTSRPIRNRVDRRSFTRVRFPHCLRLCPLRSHSAFQLFNLQPLRFFAPIFSALPARGLSQFWQRALDHLPDDFEIEPEVIVHDSVPQPSDLRPWDPFVALLELRRQPAYRLADHLQVTHYRIDRLLVLQKLSALEPGHVSFQGRW